jgi:asparagine synthase (glutamine-hydrolysing)
MVDLALSLPPRWSLHGRTTKALVRRMLRGRVPDAILDRPKKGFGIPIARWLRTDLRPLLEEHLSPARIAREGLLRPEAVTALVEAHQSGRADHRKELFNLLVFELWLSRWVG